MTETINNENPSIKAKRRSRGDYNADSIRQLKPLQHIYKRPGMYIGGTDENGKHHILNEVIDNSVDEYTSGTCDKIVITLHNDESITVEDNGRGIPTGLKENGIPAATLAVTSPQAGGKFDDGVYQNSGGMNGTGVAATNATSEYFETIIKREGKIHYQRFELHFDENGEPDPAKLVIPLHVIGECPIDETGTTIRFKPDPKLFSQSFMVNNEVKTEYYKFNAERIKNRLEGSACLNKGLEIIFIDERDEVKKPTLAGNKEFNGIATVEFLEDGSEKTTWSGLSMQDYLSSLRTNALIEKGSNQDNEENQIPELDMSMIDGLEEVNQEEQNENNQNTKPNVTNAIYDSFFIEDDVSVRNKTAKMGEVKVNIVFQWFKDDNNLIKSFVNNIPTPSNGTHVKGFETGIQNTLKEYIENTGSDKVKRDFAKITNSDILEGLNAIVSVKISEPVFKSQTKEQLTDERGFNAVETVISKNFTRILEENPEFSNVLVERVLKAKRAREVAERARQDANQEKKVAKMSMPSKLIDCQSTDPKMRELFIVEGDSAAGSAKEARDKKYQAVLPIRGKVLNVYGQSSVKTFANAEISGIAAVLGCGTGSKLDLNKLRYHKIIILTDADEDGKHIQTLLITMFYVLYPTLIKEGHIYIAKPPLFSVKRKRNGSKPIYLKNRREFEEFFKNQDESQWEISRFKGLGEMNYDTLRDTTMSITDSELYQLRWDDADYEEIKHTFEVVADEGQSDILKEWIIDYEPNDDFD